MEKIRKNKNYFFQIFIWDMIFYLSESCVRISLILDVIWEIKKKLWKKTKSHYGHDGKIRKNQKYYFFPKLYLGYNFLTVVNIVSKFH